MRSDQLEGWLRPAVRGNRPVDVPHWVHWVGRNAFTIRDAKYAMAMALRAAIAQVAGAPRTGPLVQRFAVDAFAKSVHDPDQVAKRSTFTMTVTAIAAIHRRVRWCACLLAMGQQ